MKKKLLLFFFLLSILTAKAQNAIIKGRVTDEAGQPIQGASVVLKGSSKGTETAKDGSFELNNTGKPTGTLIISYVGFQTQNLVYRPGAIILAKLEKDNDKLDDVVIIGYQAVKRRDVLASVASVSARDIKDIPINSAAEALNGRLAGVTATTAEGSPDAAIRIRVRGGMSITGDNSPLYIVDGVQVENGLSAISPQDIQSIDVLKDAAATAIYGARGANGVIVITTKSGRQGKMRVSYNGFVGVKVLAKKLDVLSPFDYVIYQSERSRGSATDSTTFTRNFGTTWDTLINYQNVAPVDWQEEVMGRTGVMQTHNVNLNGGNKKFVYNFAYTYNEDKAIVINSLYKRHLLNFRGDYNIAKNLKAGISTRYTYQDVIGAGVSDAKGSSYNRLRNAVKYRPFLSSTQDVDDPDPLADPNVGNGLNLYNPVALAGAEFRQKSTTVYNLTLNLNYQIIKNLSFRTTFGYDYNNFIDRQFNDSITPYAILQGSRRPVVGLDTVTRNTITNSNVLTYSLRNYKKLHDIDIIIGQETYDLKTTTNNNLWRLFPLNIAPKDAFGQTSLGTAFPGFPKLNKTRYTNLSFFSRISYGYKGKYLLSFNVRADGASKFAPGKQWGYFPAGSVAWRLKNEDFLKKSTVISDLKLRYGFGTVGNNRINDYLFLTTFRNDGTLFYGLNNQLVNAFSSAGLVNEALRWESTVNRNFGIDISLFKRIDISLDIYNNSSKDLLLNVPIASTFGYSTQLQNIGRTSNKGVELQISASILRKNNGLNWSASFNISTNKNTVEELGRNQTSFFPSASWGVSGQPTDYIVRIGDPVGSMWGLQTDGFYQVSDFNYNSVTGVYTLKSGVVSNAGIIGPVQPGSIKFKDLNGDGVVDLINDRSIIGRAQPKFTGGLNQQFTYKNWDMSLFVNFSYGNNIYNANKIEFTNGYTGNSNMLADMAARWKVVTANGQTAQWINASNQVVGIPPDQLAALNANATIWQPLKSAGAFFPHSWAIEDGSFLRINNLTMGYTLSSKALGRMKISKLRFYFTGNNLAIFTKYTGYDPEVSVAGSPLTQGLDYSAYPKSRSFIFGINATF